MIGLEFPILIIATIANVSLAIVVLQYAERNISRNLFSFFVISQILWFFTNYLGFQVTGETFLWVVRFTLFFAAFHAFFFFLFIYSFLERRQVLTEKILVPLIGFLSVVAALTLSPLLFPRVMTTENGELAPYVGPGMPVFGLFVAVCVLGGFRSLVRKYRRSEGLEREQWRYLTYGLSLTFFFILAFSFIGFVFFGEASTVRLGHIYTFPFVGFTAYAMVRHKLLNVKAIVAEVAVILLNLIVLIQLSSSDSVEQFVTNSFVLIGTAIVGFLLVRGVIQEVKQRQQLELLTKELETMNQQLKALDKARAEFISIASHQLRTPPATLKWYLASLLGGDFGPVSEKVKQAVLKAQSTNNSMVSLIDDLLNASRIERGKMEFLFEPVDLTKLAQTTVDQLLPQAFDRRLKLTFVKPKGRLPIVSVDKEKIRQVMNNFVDNAIKYTKAGKITVELFQKGKEIWFKVTDTGKGIDPLQLENIFDKYSRGHDAASHATGLGLGLYVAKVVVEQHQGKIWAESPGEGKGSTFIFSLPLKSNLKATGLWDLSEKKIK